LRAAGFFEALDDDMDKVAAFVEASLSSLNDRVDALAAEVGAAVRQGQELQCTQFP
jgi:SPX domain protein involved in polyphosphate accumulation